MPETPAVSAPAGARADSHSTDERTAPGIGPGSMATSGTATVPSPAAPSAAGATLTGPPPTMPVTDPGRTTDAVDEAKTTPFLQPGAMPGQADQAGGGSPPAPPTAAQTSATPPPSGGAPAAGPPGTGAAKDESIVASDLAAAKALAAAPAKGAAVHVNVFGRTEVGLVREHNEDNFLVADLTTGNRSLLPEVRSHDVGKRGSLFVVCDGMGGAAAGEVASQLAVDTIFERLLAAEPPRSGLELAREIVSAIEEAGSRIFSSAKLDRSRRGMGTTVTAAGLLDSELFLAQVGDSRGYVVRGDQIQLVTRDQSLVNQLIEAGQLTPEEAEAFEHSNIILQALGTAAEVSVDVTHVMLRKGDTLVVCSDGLSGLVSADQIKETVLAVPEPIECCKRLTEMANSAGGHDNITVIVARFEGDEVPEPKPEDLLVFERVQAPSADRAVDEPARSVSAKESPASSAGEGAFSEPDAEPEPRRRGGVPLLLLVLVLLAAASLAYVIFGGGWVPGQPEAAPTVTVAVPSPPPPLPSASPPPSDPAPARNTPAQAPAPTATPTSFHTRIAGASLRVDGADRGRFRDGAVKIPLAPGPHDVSVIVGGSAVVSKRVTVLAGVDNDFTLEEPGRGSDAAPAPLAPVAPVPLGGEEPDVARANPPRVPPPTKAPNRRLPDETSSRPQPPPEPPPTSDGLPANPFDQRKSGPPRGQRGAAPPGQPF
ncbi:MAG: serine/threonine-protein phosphatase [Deltaproteobacteria bacterium]|nr:serine/threonine-protein phosphatase [Deltaproteobacteria bacterium]